MVEATIDPGDAAPIVHFRSRLYTFDVLVGWSDLGLALRSSIELYGNPGIGKSTIAQYLSCCIRPEGNIYLADLEGTLDITYLRSVIKQTGFKGTFKVIPYAMTEKEKKRPRPHEEMTSEVVDHLMEEDTNAAIIDSLGAFTPTPEREGDIDDAYMGMRAKRIANLGRRAAAWLRISEPPSELFLVNHVLDEIGGQGHYTPGGKTKNFLANYRIMLYKDKGWDEGYFAVAARAEKLKYGGTKKDARGFIFMVPGFGVSPEMTAVYDCTKLGLAEAKAHIRMEVDGKDKSFGFISKLVEAATTKDVDHDRFRPFFEKLEQYYEVVLGPTSGTEQSHGQPDSVAPTGARKRAKQ